MEKKIVRKGPLPEGRQGASGAGAGRDSMRAASRARGVARPPSSPPHPSSPPEGLVSAGSSRTQQAAPAAGGARRMRWSKSMNENALRAYFRAKGEETGCLAYRARMHRFFAELEPSLSVTEQNLADRVRYILRSNIFGDAELERLRREAIPSSNGNATAGNAAPLDAQQTAYVDAAVNIPFVANSDDDGIVSHKLEKMRSILEESMLETRSMPLENRPRLPRIPLSKRNRAVVRALNPMLVTYLEASRDLCETDSILFGAALAVCRIIGAKLPVAGRATQKSSAIPAWRKRIEDRIAKARALIGRLTSFRSGNNRPRIMRTVRMAFAGTNINLFQPDITQKLTERIDDLKQKIAAWGKRIRRFSERSRRFNQNRLFQSDQKRLYKTLERPEVCGAGPGPDHANTVAFWHGLWSEPVNHSEGPWMEVVASQSASVTPMDPVTITPEDVAEAEASSTDREIPAELQKQEAFSTDREIPAELQKQEASSTDREIPAELQKQEASSTKLNFKSRRHLQLIGKIPAELQKQEASSTDREIPAELQKQEASSTDREIPAELQKQEASSAASLLTVFQQPSAYEESQKPKLFCLKLFDLTQNLLPEKMFAVADNLGKLKS
ncbi:unnamed protein product [Parnassius apollo]|uniref:(apollo) hypothetical protein n=1 Tax=Parnassius apollo TaxID=110799 RepID=A0A8S3XUH4_PARAO|nr:unnamed protein product [Parnassius apollo]